MGNRIYYAVQQAGIGGANGQPFTPIHGLQSVGISTSYSIEPVQSCGEIALSGIIENNYEVQINLKKVLDGYSLIYLLATQGSIDSTLHNRALTRTSFALSVFDDKEQFAYDTPLSTLQSTGLYISSVKYIFDANSNFSEEVGFVGNHKSWDTSFLGVFDNTDSPASVGGISRRWDINLGSTIIPSEIPSDSHINNITVSANINRENIPQFGSKIPFFRLPTLPMETTAEITITPTGGYNISTPVNMSCTGYSSNAPQPIYISVCNDLTVDMGTNNRLVAVSYQGGDAGGGNVKTTYTYKGYNDFTVTHLVH